MELSRGESVVFCDKRPLEALITFHVNDHRREIRKAARVSGNAPLKTLCVCPTLVEISWEGQSYA